MRSATSAPLDFMDWYDSLSDEDQCKVEQLLKDAARDLGLFVPELPFIAYDFFEFHTDIVSKISLN